MAQVELFNLLQNNPDKWFTVSEIQKVIKVKRTNITSAISKLHKFKLVERRYGYKNTIETKIKNRLFKKYI